MEAIFNFLMKNPGGMMVLQWLFVIMGAIIVFFIRKYFKDRNSLIYPVLMNSTKIYENNIESMLL